MTRTSANRWGVGAVAALGMLAALQAAHAQGFFKPLFEPDTNPAILPGQRGPAEPGPGRSLPFANEGDMFGRPAAPPRPRAVAAPAESGGSQAYCVRTCDGRYFPITTGDNQSTAASCNSFCPASETRIVYGSSIDHAATDNGKPYSQLPNAFRYRNELVAGCTCNGKDSFGLAQIRIEDDPTLRKGDIVAGANGLVVASRVAEKRGGSVNFSPAAPSVQAKYQRVPVVAAE
ncbi:MAG: hypothetical protein QOH32_2029 [Bradyrhizobium sp.]|jgi:hypothetical protein|nr:hypothetical protein [Bradyrhizobium sp.]